MAAKPKQESGLDLDTRDGKTIFHDFVYRPDMTIDEVSQYLGVDWDDAYNWLKGQLEQAKERPEDDE